MKLLIIRHAQSANNANMDARVADPTITEVGHRQAGRLAESRHLFAEIDRLYVSPMRRTLQTAAPIANSIGLTARVFTGLHEWGGVWEERDGAISHFPGLGRSEMSEIIPEIELPDDVLEEGWWSGDNDTSTFEAALALSRQNAHEFLGYIARRYPDETQIAIVTHGGYGSNLIEAALGLDMHPETARFVLNNTGHALIELDGRHGLMRWHNRIDHLTHDLITT
jgi:2,3-bisphosphoglycerate-dependent phosphoglycerate mutase